MQHVQNIDRQKSKTSQWANGRILRGGTLAPEQLRRGLDGSANSDPGTATGNSEDKHVAAASIQGNEEKPWLRLPPKAGQTGKTEGRRSWEAFHAYLSLPPGTRSLARAAQQLHKSVSLLERWSVEFRWQQRVAAWDAHGDEQRERARQARLMGEVSGAAPAAGQSDHHATPEASHSQEPAKPWHRLSGESAPAHEAARTYFELASDRSLPAVAQRLGKCISLIKRWSAKYCWRDRADAFDGHQEAIVQEPRNQLERENHLKWAARQEQQRERLYQVGTKFLDKADAMLAFPLAQTTSSRSVAEDGSVAITRVIEPTGWTMNMVPLIAEFGVRLATAAIRNEVMRLTERQRARP